MNRGFIKPDISAHGKGTKNLFSKNTLCTITALRWLIAFGIRREVAARCVKNIDWGDCCPSTLISRGPIRLSINIKPIIAIVGARILLVEKEKGE